MRAMERRPEPRAGNARVQRRSSRYAALQMPRRSAAWTEDRWDPVGAVTASAAEADRGDCVLVLRPSGPLPDPLPPSLVERLEGLLSHQPAIVDLSGIGTVSAAVVGLTGWVVSAYHHEPTCVVCSPSTRARLRQWPILRCVAVFGSVGDALQARRFARDGYGPGWSPEPSV